MKSEQMLCSFKNALKLDALSVRRESYFTYDSDGDVYAIGAFGFRHRRPKTFVSAHTVGELFDAAKEYTSDLSIIYQTSGKWLVAYEVIGGRLEYFYAEKLADALCIWLIWLIENGHVNVEEINGVCLDCGGQGFYAHQHGAGDVEQVQCFRCKGTGKHLEDSEEQS